MRSNPAGIAQAWSLQPAGAPDQACERRNRAPPALADPGY
jgi:hypothetical protein